MTLEPKKNTLLTAVVLLIGLTLPQFIAAQPMARSGINIVPEEVYPAVAMLRANPDAADGGMGHIGLVGSPGVADIFRNPAKLTLNEQAQTVGAHSQNWSFRFSDFSVTQVGATSRLADRHTIGASFRYMRSLKNTDPLTDYLVDFRKFDEFSVDLAYAYALSKYWGIGLTGRYISSRPLEGIGSPAIESASSAAMDIGVHWKRTYGEGEKQHTCEFGTALSNLGGPIRYTDSIPAYKLPGNFGAAFAYTYHKGTKHSLMLAIELNRSLLPSYAAFFSSGSNEEKSVIGAAISSFADGSFKEEWLSNYFSAGVEYGYKQKYFIRMGEYVDQFVVGPGRLFTTGVGAALGQTKVDFGWQTDFDNVNVYMLGLNFEIGPNS